MKILFVSNLFPNSVDPSRGLFSINQLRALRKLGCEFKVVAPVSRFPLVRSTWAVEARGLPRRETVDGFDVYHPRALYMPRNRGALNAHLYRRSVNGTIERLCAQQRPDLMWGSFAFPDGVAVAGLAGSRGLPFVVSLLGSDINLNMTRPGRRRAIVESLKGASLVLAKSRALKEIVVGMSVPPDRVILDYNGVDHDVFSPSSREGACRELDVDPAKRRVLFVGNFVDVKNIPTLVRAFASVVAKCEHGAPPDLVLIGGGPLKADVIALAGSLGVRDRVHLTGSLRPPQVATWMSACDLLCLPSKNEGVPNVVLEAFACGLPVVASRVGGIPEIHPGDSLGALFDPRDADELAAKLCDVFAGSWDRETIAAHARPFTWRRNAEKVVAAFDELVTAARPAA